MPLEQNVLQSEPAIDEVGQLEVAEYVVFLLALDTYIRYVSEFKGLGASDDLIQKAVKLVRLADGASGDAFKAFFLENLTKEEHKNQLTRAFRFSLNQNGLAERAYRIRNLLKRGGPSLLNALFTESKARQEVKKAMTALNIDDADQALKALADLPMRNPRTRKWIDQASELAGSQQFLNPVAAVADDLVGASAEILDAKVTQSAIPGTEQAKEALAKQENVLAAVQANATATAAKALRSAGIEDKPATTSEVHGIVAATVAAVISTPEIPKNLPAAFINNGKALDPEQVAAALTDGRVLVAAGAGAGKSTTLVSRIAYLINDRGCDSGKIVACTFNRKASLQLEGKIDRKVGTNNVHCSTMHSLFLNFVVGNKSSPGLGSPTERAMLQSPRLITDKGKLTGTTMSVAVRNTWADCKPEVIAAHYGFPLEWVKSGPPKPKAANSFLNQWRGNGVTLELAKQEVRSQAEALGYIWYDMYLGLKGDTPGWAPPCESGAHRKFMGTHRKGGERLGDMEDMQKILLDILRSDPKKRERVQNAFEHILVDEAQDLNLVQHEIYEIMSGKITPGDGKSMWMIGDDKQCIYQFRGSKPELFVAFAKKEGWTTRQIRTNYRCEPEIVEAANRLQVHNEDKIDMECRAAPSKKNGTASITVDTPPDSASAAIGVINEIVDKHKHGEPLQSFAILARTNKELNDFETACIIGEMRYVKKSGKGFLEAPESRALLGYLDLAAGDSYESMKKSLVAAILCPERNTFLNFDEAEKCVDEALRDVARLTRVDKSLINPNKLLEGKNVSILARALKRPYEAKLMEKGEWLYKKAVSQLTENLEGLASDIRVLRMNMEDNPQQPTSELLNTILDGISSTVYNYEKGPSGAGHEVASTKTLREQISLNNALFSDDDEPEEERTDEEKEEAISVDEGGGLVDKDKKAVAEGAGLGAVQFLFQLAIPNANDAANATDPSNAAGFARKLARYRALGDKLRVDTEQWESEHGDEPAPALTLSTVHKVKGAEWENVFVVMTKGKFPIEIKPKPGDPPPDPVKEQKRIEAERNLAYVAITRAQKNLNIICAGTKRGGLSQFVEEAGLVRGENVVQPDSVAKSSEPEIKTASVDLPMGFAQAHGFSDDQSADETYNVTYDRREP